MSDSTHDDNPAEVEGDQTLNTGTGIEDFYSAMQRERESQYESYRTYAGSELYTKHLRSALASFTETDDLEVGDLVQWKTFLRNAEYPDYGAPAILMEFRDVPEISVASTIERQDVVIGVLDQDQDLRLVVTDRRRLTTWEADGA
ncbi:hypothetical protein ACNPNP_11690 [Microbacterium sp. AGC85]